MIDYNNQRGIRNFQKYLSKIERIPGRDFDGFGQSDDGEQNFLLSFIIVGVLLANKLRTLYD